MTHGFHRLSMRERREWILAQRNKFSGEILWGARTLSDEEADLMVENAIGCFKLPMGVVPSLIVNGESRIIPMVTEEPSVIAAVCKASKTFNAAGGVVAHADPPVSVGQILLYTQAERDEVEKLRDIILRSSDSLIKKANQGHSNLIKCGGGARSLDVFIFWPAARDITNETFLLVELTIHTGEAMGANVINSMCEGIAPDLEAMTGARRSLCILSNDGRQRLATAEIHLPFKVLDGTNQMSGDILSENIQRASIFAERNPLRAVTHNKGILNGIEAVLLPFGQDTRAAVSSILAFAASAPMETRPLAIWRVEGDALCGKLTLPMPVGAIGGVRRKYPAVNAMYDLMPARNSQELACAIAAVGLAQNFAALLALTTEGIQSGHMKLHLRQRNEKSE